jgi:hypothetical protein
VSSAFEKTRRIFARLEGQADAGNDGGERPPFIISGKTDNLLLYGAAVNFSRYVKLIFTIK